MLAYTYICYHICINASIYAYMVAYVHIVYNCAELYAQLYTILQKRIHHCAPIRYLCTIVVIATVSLV